ncbi:hypothetical protein LZ31DRAFT_343967 [Colletotrichum somersetense]|nr:hypothetical protein LZ31DRAFT_343967 [Colletotrichum somersetense]
MPLLFARHRCLVRSPAWDRYQDIVVVALPLFVCLVLSPCSRSFLNSDPRKDRTGRPLNVSHPLCKRRLLLTI